jgi:hypothetical protein
MREDDKSCREAQTVMEPVWMVASEVLFVSGDERGRMMTKGI